MPANPTGPPGRTTMTVYDSAGRPTRVSDPPGEVTTTVYDLDGPAGTVPSGNLTWVRLDAEGNVIDRGTGAVPEDNPLAPGSDEPPPDEPHIVE